MRLFGLIAVALAVGSLGLGATTENFADFNYSRPDGWTLKRDAITHAAVLTPDKHASTIFIQPQTYRGTSETWHRELWTLLIANLKPLGAATEGQRGKFTTTWQAFDRGDGTQSWLCLYTTLFADRGEGVLFAADAEDPFQKYLAAANQLVDGITLGSALGVASHETPVPKANPLAPTTAPANTPAATPTVAAAVTSMPSPTPALVVNVATSFKPTPAADSTMAVRELKLEPPAGWTARHDPRTGITSFKPPNAPTTNVAGLLAFPSVHFTGAADLFHQQTLQAAIQGGRLTEPVQTENQNGLIISRAHFITSKGWNMRVVLFTARWGERAQAFLFATGREDLYQIDGPIANDAVRNIPVPTTTPPTSQSALVDAPLPPSTSGDLTNIGANIAPAPTEKNMSTTNPASASTDSLPVLNYTDPPNFYRGGKQNFAEYSSNQVNFSLCVYPFRPYTGDIKAAFQKTLLRDWMDIQYREENVAAPPRFSSSRVPGADAVIDAHFQENIVGLLNERHRILIIAGNMAAVVDLKARNSYCWQTAFPSASAMLSSLLVGRKQAPPSVTNGPGAPGAAIAGLFMGTKMKFLALGVTDFTGHAPALHYFLFSADGHVFRCYDLPPGGSENAARQFDFDTAARQDPVNSGRFAIRGNELYIKWNGPNNEETTTTLGDPNLLLLDSVKYVRKW